MMQRATLLFVVCGLVAGASDHAWAQTAWEDRAYASLSFGVESGDAAFSDARNFSIYEEGGSVTSSASFKSGPIVDLALGARVWRNLAVGLAFHRESPRKGEGTLAGSVPNPIFFNQPRTFSAAIAGLERRENAVHIQAGWVVVARPNVDVLLFGGPSLYRLEQVVVRDVTVGEVGAPFTQVVVQPKVETEKKNPFGYNVGADVTYLVWQNDSVRLGAGVLVRFTRASDSVRLLATDEATDVGGFHVAVGGRLRF